MNFFSCRHKINEQWENFSNGGRVLNITSTGNNYLKYKEKIIKIIKKLNWKDGFFRKDIGWKMINDNENNKWFFKR